MKDSAIDKLWYVSYEDPTLAKIDKSYAFVNVENNTNYKKQYYYDLSYASNITNATKNLITKPGQAYYYDGEWHDLYPNTNIVGCIRVYLT